MAYIPLPSVITEYPNRCDIKRMEHVVHVGIALKVARNIYMRCRLGEAQNWKCCWCGIECHPEPGQHDSATIEHVTPRSLGGTDEWENLAMACASCNHRRGTISVEDMLAGCLPAPKPAKASQIARRNAKAVRKYIAKAHKFNQNGWFKENGEVLCKREWFNSLRIASKSNQQKLLDVVFPAHDYPRFPTGFQASKIRKYVTRARRVQDQFESGQSQIEVEDWLQSIPDRYHEMVRCALQYKEAA